MADLKASLCGELPNQESVIPKEQLRNLLERRGIVSDPDIPNAKVRLAEQELRRNMYHNTQVMLKHYRDIVWALECFPSEVAQELDQPLKDLDALLSVVDTQVALGNAKLEHRLLSIRKSRLLLDRINEALTVLRHKPGNGELMYKVRVYNLLQPEYSDSWNCMFDLGGDTLMAQILTDVIISNTKGDEKGDHFWDNGESNLLKSLILYVDLDSTRTPEERNLAAVYQMLTQHTEKELTMLFDRLPIGHPAKGPYSLFSQASDTVRAGIVLGLGTRLQVLQSEAVRRITRSSDIDLSEPGWSKCAYYIILDDQNSSLEFLSALFFAFLFIKLVRYADSTPEQRCKVPVNIILDEMNNIGTIKDFGRRLSTIRSRALQVIMCSQSLPQLQNRYPNNLWAELLGNADTQIMLGATDDVTAEYFSARSGDMTVEVNSTMTTRQSLALAQVIPQYRYTEGIGRRRVLTPDEVLRLPNDELLIILRGQKVLRAKKFDFTEHPYAKECERTSIQRYQTDPAPAQPPEPPAQSMPAEPDMDKPPGPAPAAAAKPPVKAKPPQAKPKAPVPKSPSSGGQPSELPAKPAKRPKTLYESSRPPADF